LRRKGTTNALPAYQRSRAVVACLVSASGNWIDCAREAGAAKQRLPRQDRAPLRPMSSNNLARPCLSACAPVIAREMEQPIARAATEQQGSQTLPKERQKSGNDKKNANDRTEPKPQPTQA